MNRLCINFNSLQGPWNNVCKQINLTRRGKAFGISIYTSLYEYRLEITCINITANKLPKGYIVWESYTSTSTGLLLTISWKQIQRHFSYGTLPRRSSIIFIEVFKLQKKALRIINKVCSKCHCRPFIILNIWKSYHYQPCKF